MDERTLSRLRNHKSKAIRKLATRDAGGASEITFFWVLIKLIDSMKPELGIVSYISHAELAKRAGVSERQVRAMLIAARAVGAIKVRYRRPDHAHADLITKYPDYPAIVGKPFTMFRVERDTLNFYTIRKCSDWEGYSTRKDALLPDWQLGIIKAHAGRRATEIDIAYRTAGSRVHKRQRMKLGRRGKRSIKTIPSGTPVAEEYLRSHATDNSHAPTPARPRLSVAEEYLRSHATENSLPKKGECEETPQSVISSSPLPVKKILTPPIQPSYSSPDKLESEPEVHPGIPEPDPLSTLQEDTMMPNPDQVLKNLMTYIDQHDLIPDATVDKIVATVSKYKDNPLATKIKDTIISNSIMAKACGYDGK